MENRKRVSLVSILVVLLCLSVCIGLTYAYFTDRATSSNNIIKVGKLDVTMEYANGTADPSNAVWEDASTGAIFNYDKWEPGYTEVYHIRVSNVGTLALKYNFVIVANGTVSELADAIDVYYFDPAEQINERTDLVDTKKIGNLTAALTGMKDTATGNLLAGETLTITIALKMQEDAGNRYQGLSIGTDFSIQLHATQLNSETDSFGPDYDEDAVIPCPHVPDIWVVDTEPTATAEGSKHATCTICNRTIQEAIPKLGYSPVKFTLSDDRTYYIASGLNDTSVKEVVIPDTYNGIPVKAVGENSFAGYYEITSVTIPYGVTTIGDRAFYYCNSLEMVTIPYSVASIGTDVFTNNYDVTIYCREASAPSTWSSNWNFVSTEYDENDELVDYLAPVVWAWSYGEEYTYNFVTNGGDPIDSITAGTKIELPTPYREGYIFIGWYDNAAFEGAALASPYHSTTEHTLYAKWMTLAQCFENGPQMMLNQKYRVEITEGGQRAYFTFTPEETGTYAFYTSNCEENDYYVSTRGILYGSSFDDPIADEDYGTAGNGSFVIVCELEAGQTYCLITELSYYETGSFNVAVVSNPTTYTLQAGGGHIIKYYEEIDPPSSIVSPIAVTLPTLYRDGYIFCGWYDNEACTGDALPYPYYNEENCTVYAKWQTLAQCFAEAAKIEQLNELYPVDITFGGQRVFYCFKPEETAPYKFVVSSADGNDDAYVDIYIYDVTGERISHEEYSSSIWCQLTKDDTYYVEVKYRADNPWNTYSLNMEVGIATTYSFDTNGGFAIEDEISSNYIWLPTPERDGAIFLGWYESADFSGKAFAAGDRYSNESSCTLYAKWLTPADISTELQGTLTLDTPYTINIATGGHQVFLAFEPTTTDIYGFFTNGENSIEGRLYNSALEQVGSSNYDNLSISCELIEGETYYLMVGFTYSGDVGSFNLTVSGPKTYTFEANGGLGEYGEPIESITSSETIELPTPYKENGFFGGWYTNAECEGEAVISPYYSAENRTLYAKWLTAEEILNQAVTVETHRYCFTDIVYGGQTVYYAFVPHVSGTYSFNISVYGVLYDSNLNRLTDGYNNEAYAARARIIRYELIAGETYYFAVSGYNSFWTGEVFVDVRAPIIYTFETNGGNAIDSIASASGIELPTATKAGAIFLGWYENAKFTGDVFSPPDSYYADGDCTLYAKWVTLDEIDDLAISMQSNNVYSGSIKTSEPKVIYTFTAVKSGIYSFNIVSIDDGWNSIELNCHLYDFDLTLLHSEYYCSELNYALEAGETYYLMLESYDGAETGSFEITAIEPYTYTLETFGGVVLDEESGTPINSITSAIDVYLPTPEKEHAIFLGWYKDPAFTEKISGHWYKAESDCTVYANWMISSDIPTQSTPMIPGEVYSTNVESYGEIVFYSFTPSADGTYEFFSNDYCDAFGRLYDSELNEIECSRDYGFSVIHQLKADTTYYLALEFDSACEVNVTVNVAYTYTFITNSEYDEDYTALSADGVGLSELYNEGYVFDGWYEDESLTIKANINADGTYLSEGNCTLYAKWLDPFAQAIAMSLDTTYTTNMTTGGEKVYYAFTPEASGTYVFSSSTVDPDIYVDPRAYLYNSSKEIISDSDDDAGDYNFLIEYSLTADETYYLVIELWDSGQTDPVAVTVSLVS